MHQFLRHASTTLIALVVVSVATVPLWGQSVPAGPSPSVPLPEADANARASQPVLAAVQIKGNRNIAEDQIRRHIKARPGIPFDPDIVREDVRRLYSSRWFHNVKPVVQQTAQGMVLTYQVTERPTAEAVRFVGNRHFSDAKLLKECGLKPGDSLNAYALREAQRSIEELYRKAGIPNTKVEIAEGHRPQDHRAVFLIEEGKLQRVYKVEFVGNDPSLATDGRLKTQIKTKPGLLKYFIWGKYDEQQLAEDIERLTAYYRNLGYFRARISRELEWDRSGHWVTVRFVIDEGPRYRVRNVTILGNETFATEDLVAQLALQAGDYFQMSNLRADERTLRDLYGSQGYIFADIESSLRFAEQPGALDIVYKVTEGDQFRVGRINVHIGGELPHTKMTVVLNRLSLRPGDIIDIREIRASERRLKASNVFETNPSVGEPPRIEIRPLGVEETVRGGESSGSTYRGQSPDAGRPRPAVIHLFLPPLKR